MSAENEVSELANDLSPIYGTMTPIAGGMRRETLVQIKEFYRLKVEELQQITGSCVDCAHMTTAGQYYCRKWRDTVPPEFVVTGCDEWQFDGIPF